MRTQDYYHIFLPILLLLTIFLIRPTSSSSRLATINYFNPPPKPKVINNVAVEVPSIHQLLMSYGLPGGLFPREVKSFQLDLYGLLEVRFEQPCLATFEENVRFERVVRANLSYGGLKGVEGMSQQELFLWFSVKDIVVADPSSGIILFDIGVAHKQLSLSLFEDSPSCRPQENAMWKLEAGWKQLVIKGVVQAEKDKFQ